MRKNRRNSIPNVYVHVTNYFILEYVSFPRFRRFIGAARSTTMYPVESADRTFGGFVLLVWLLVPTVVIVVRVDLVVAAVVLSSTVWLFAPFDDAT
mmetsp:Transcript_1835/g.2652  ORF Transcript_1835/g.2652 Transcript_1835/m.2652 type:complete len:96 (+) Transcript_1835:1400-1687(+)